MERVMLLKLLFSLICLSTLLEAVISSDSLTPSRSLIDGQTLISSSDIFELGFFFPGISKNRYLGIWFKTTPNVVVWVANRNNPLNDSLGELAISNNGSVALFEKKGSVVWSTGSVSALKNPVAQLLDTGNFVLRENDAMSSENYLWQSFDYPTDTLLAGMKLGWDLRTGLERALTSWKNADDPSTGNYTYRMDTVGLPQLVLAMGSTKKFRTGTWNGVRFSGVHDISDTVFESSFEFSENESYYMFTPIYDSVITRITMNSSGLAQRLTLNNESIEWDVMYSVPYQRCDSYGFCGTNSICGTDAHPMCRCLEGFAPSSEDEWKVLKWSKGCVRKMELSCQKGVGFVKLVGVKLPNLLEFQVNKSTSLEECKDDCLKNCSCTAYANSDIRGRGSGCLMWFGDLVDIQDIRVEGSDQVLYIRLSASDIKSMHDANKKKRLIIVVVVLATLSFCILALVLCYLFWKVGRRTRTQIKNEKIELPLFELATIATATNSFSSKIGEGGFGPVYKGKLLTGQEIAVKRLSKNSVQGLEEFKNEVVLIAKLQHRNLVALLGCCVEGEERMLIYEYLCNKSLDHIIFDQNKRASLNWEKRFNIIMGIARGLLYLHQDSKLQIIHRDLKASNILLDINMNPKISDFGLARIFGGDENETKTKRVVGTYGYLSPEYAVDGKFSVKSDVFSFGVVLLEILSGRRNRGFSHPDHDHNLLGHVWLLWNEDKALELLTDTILESSCNESQVLRCVHVGLLCVQKFPANRPTMATVVVMLANERAEMPWPKQPAFFTERSCMVTDPMSSEEELHTRNDTSITSLEGR